MTLKGGEDMKIKKIKIKKFGKRGVLGLETATQFVLAIMILAVIAFSLIVALSSLNNSNALTAGSQEANDSSDVLLNVTGGVVTLMSNAGTWFSLISVVIIILIIAVVIVAVNRFGGRTGGGL